MNWRAVCDDFRNWLGERLEPVVKTLLRVRTRQLLPLRVESLPKQPVSIDLLDRAFDRRAAGPASEENRENLRRVIEEAGSRSTADAPRAWLSMDFGADQAEVHLTMWPGGERRLIAQAGLHGGDVKVL